MQIPKPFTVLQPIAGENPKPLFILHAYSLEQARAIAASKVAGETIVVGPVPRDGAPMIPDTLNGLPAMACVSAMQKAIRRSMEREAMEFAVELMHTSKAFHTMVCNRLEIICHEDLDTLAAPHVFPFVAASLAASRDRYSKSIGEARLTVGNASRRAASASMPRQRSDSR
ncbi:hypothetical protein [Bradyrhizobium sp. Ai1a-2]|uniref:hypothetical protein n=1 Tax=Bradyrhizobium sp. Ai1a-2 TaxID=196490 RepID=UPI0012695277|nr:hypothetical protein [Bradyrhizobium sp. Ai1a-2]